LFTRGIEIAETVLPKAIMFENVRGMLEPKFASYREQIELRLRQKNYVVFWHKVQASDFGVPQLRPRMVMVALKRQFASSFMLNVEPSKAPSVGQVLLEAMSANGWTGAAEWAGLAAKIAPTIVGGSKKHGGPDLGPTRARNEWLALGIDGRTIAENAPEANFAGVPRLTVQMVALLQGFPPQWQFVGKKTAAYRQVGNAFPPPVAAAVGRAIGAALRHGVQDSGLEAAE
jgi:DNA (cytosine-5)-methyltransferase 1